MFERAVIIEVSAEPGRLALGKLFDALLYYSHVEVVLSANTLALLWQQIGFQNLIELLSCENLHVTISTEDKAISKNDIGFLSFYNPTFFQFVGNQESGIFRSNYDIFESAFLRSGIDDSVNVKKLREFINLSSYSKLLDYKNAGRRIFESLIGDQETMRMFVDAYLIKNGIADTPVSTIELKTSYTKFHSGYTINSNFHLKKVTAGLTESWSDVLIGMVDYWILLQLSDLKSADIICSASSERVALERMDLGLQRATKSKEKIQAFESIEFTNSVTFGDMVDARKISIRDAVALVRDTHKFREWLIKKDPDADLLREFNAALREKSFAEKLPGKAIRFFFFSAIGEVADALGAGGVGKLAALGLSAFDNFLLEKFARGWRPNCFVEQVNSALPT